VSCCVRECPHEVYQRGMCRMHYFRWYRHGDPTVAKPPGPGFRGLSAESQVEIRKRAGHAAGTSKARNRETRGWWLHWLLRQVRRYA
jgi:hypothetical protein